MRRVFLTPDAVRQFKRIAKAARPLVKEAIRKHLVEADPAETTRNKFRLRRASEHADYELRAEPWRVFYRIEPTCVVVTLIGEKRRGTLVIDGKEIKL